MIKKKVLTLAIAVMSMAGFSAMAQNTGNANCTVNKEARCKQGANCEKTAKCKKSKCDKNLFAGMNLTEAQQTQLKQLAEKQRASRSEKMAAAKADKQRNDSVRVAERQAAKKSYLSDVKAVLTPDQYVVFLENFFVNADGGHGPRKAAVQQGHGKKQMKADGRRDKKGDKIARHGRQAKQDAKAASNA